MKPFDLEAAKAGAPLVTRDGRKAKFVAYVPEAEEGHRLIAFVTGADTTVDYFDDGYYFNSSVNDEDLFMFEEKKEPVVRWIWAMQEASSKRWYNTSYFYTDEEFSKINSSGKDTAIKLEWSRTEFPV